MVCKDELEDPKENAKIKKHLSKVACVYLLLPLRRLSTSDTLAALDRIKFSRKLN